VYDKAEASVAFGPDVFVFPVKIEAPKDEKR
jgi:hypothetical protein